MGFFETYDGISYLYDYYPVRFEQHQGVSERILAFKEGNDDAVRQFASEMKEAMDEKYQGNYEKLKNTIVCVMPSHEVGKYSEGLARLAAYLSFSYGMIDGVQLVKRTKMHDKISAGGDRSVQSQLETLEISQDYQIAGKDIIILDDVATTGNSIEAVRRLLRVHNVGKVYAQTIGKTHTENEEKYSIVRELLQSDLSQESQTDIGDSIDLLEAKSLLKKHFGYDDFRPGQEEIISAILSGKDVLAIMPTGAGKSICYQIPAMILPGITIVISPLISLMQDQVKALNEAGVNAKFINSSLSNKDITEILENAVENNLKILYVAPERLESHEFQWFGSHADISLVTVVEAHCISQWGQDFRPSYLKIVGFIRSITKRPIVSAFTATATEEVKTDINCTLNLKNPFIKITGFDRENLYFQVEQIGNKLDFIINYVENHKDDSGIIYCATRKNVDEIYETLLGRGYSVTRYHAGLSSEERKKNQDDFIYDNISVVVATNAFGMGIDKSNVRFVIHYNMPQSIENYYQEAGRAGRDGEVSNCILLFSSQDVMTQKFLLERKDFSEIAPEDIEILKERDIKRLTVMENYCRTTDCLRNYILRYFGEKPSQPCDNCGNCHREYIETDMTDAAKQVINCVFEAKGRYGVGVITGTLVGANRAKLREFGTVNYKTYGVLSNYSEGEIRELINTLVQDGYLVQTMSMYSLLQLGPNVDNLRVESKRVIVKSYREKAITLKEKKVKTHITDSLTTAGYSLFEMLRKLRTSIAREEGMPPYIIFSDKTLIDMCAKTPTLKTEMLCVNGVGENKYSKYGERFIDVIKDFLDSSDKPTIDIPDPGVELTTAKRKRTIKAGIPDEKELLPEQIKLFEYLRKIRLEKAQEEGKRAYWILTNKSLIDFVIKMPSTRAEMLEVFGVGQATVDSYGDLFLNALKRYKDENSVSNSAEETDAFAVENEGQKEDEKPVDINKTPEFESLVEEGINPVEEVQKPDFWKCITEKNQRCESMMRNMGTEPNAKYGELLRRDIYYVIGRLCVSGLLPEAEAILIYKRIVKKSLEAAPADGEMSGVEIENNGQLECYTRLLKKIKEETSSEYAEYKVAIKKIIEEIPDRKYAPVKKYLAQKDVILYRFIEKL